MENAVSFEPCFVDDNRHSINQPWLIVHYVHEFAQGRPCDCCLVGSELLGKKQRVGPDLNGFRKLVSFGCRLPHKAAQHEWLLANRQFAAGITNSSEMHIVLESKINLHFSIENQPIA